MIMTERNGHRSPVFIFPGQGTIFPRMTGELFQQCPQYAAHMTECADAFAPLLDWSIIDVITGSPSAPDHTRIDVIEPVLVAITISLARLWEDHGVKPAATIGYSLGEISATGYLGTMSLAETAATTVAWTRAQLPLAGRGAMAVVGLSRAEADDLGNGISVAAELSPASVVVAGEAPAIEELTTDLRSRQRYAQRVSVTFAAHSPVVDEQRDDLLRLLQHSHHGDAPLPYYSALAGGRLHTAGLTPSHWYEVLRQPFNLNGAVQAALADGHDAFIDLAAHPGVATALTQIFTHRGADAVSVGTLRRDQQGLSRFLSAVNEAHDAGIATREVAAPTAGQDTDHDIDPGIAELLSVVTDRVSRDLSAATPAPATVDELRLLGENPRTVSMFDLGFTSMELILLQERLQHSTGVTLESTFVLDFSTIDQMVTEIQDRQRPSAEVTSTRPAAVSDEPIAIVGMSLRLPGEVRTREQLWTLLSEEIDPVAPLDPERWAHSPLDRSEITTTDGGYLDDVDQFAPLFFGISPKEAEAMDPQQRLLLELTWEALEDHGVDPFMVGKQQRVGTWMGLIPNDYLQVGKDLGHIPDAYTAIGAMSNVAVGRVSHVFGLDGPSIAIDAACASSAHAIHMACEALRHGVCETALAGAVNVMVSPEGHISFSRLQALSPSGRCRSFDAGADGYIRSEGGAVVVLKRLSDAERDGDNIIALVTGSAIAHNGGGGGFTVPSGTAQARVIREAMAQARLTVDDIDYLEAHGSGTPIGDPQEVNSMARVFADRREPLTVGSIKSNLGHLEAAAGMAGLSKVLTSMEHGAIPATLHLQQLNPLIDWATVPIRVADRLSPWSPQGDRRRAGISSFGLSGTNAHLIVEEYPSAERVAPEATVPSLIPLSANSPEALTEAVTSTTEWAANTSVAMADLSHTWGRRRALPHRQAIVASTADDLSRASVTPVAPCDAVVMVFAGQGTQYPGMAHELYRTAPQFAAQLDRKSVV